MNTTDPVDLEALRGFTEGEWATEPYCIYEDHAWLITSGTHHVAIAPDISRSPQKFANAALIAAAPSMHAELLARRARDAEVAVLIASELARIDGYDPEDQHGGLYDLRWSGGPNPEPEGDAWHMDYLPKGERIAAILAGAKP